jgi:hypothetical protein
MGGGGGHAEPVGAGFREAGSAESAEAGGDVEGASSEDAGDGAAVADDDGDVEWIWREEVDMSMAAASASAEVDMQTCNEDK